MAQDNTAQEVQAIAQIVAALLPTVLQFGIPLVEKTISMVKNDPSIPASSLVDAITKRLSETQQNDSTILNETK